MVARTMPLLETGLAMTEQLVLVMRLRVQEVPGGLQPGRTLFRAYSVCGVHASSFMLNNGRNLLVVVETIFPCTFLWYPFPLVVVFPIPSRQFHLTAAWSECRATLSDHRLFHHRSTRHLQRLHQLSLQTSGVSITVSLRS